MKTRNFFTRLGEIGTRQSTLLTAHRIVAFLMIVGVVLTVAGMSTVPAFASGGGGGPISDDGVTTLLSMFKRLGDMFITIAYSLMVIIFAVGTVKSGLAAQAAQQFGATGRVSLEFMNMGAGIVIFVLGLISLPIVTWILGQIADLIPTNLKISTPAGFPIQIPD